jgi:pyruvate formate lyase activating enzyme
MNVNFSTILASDSETIVNLPGCPLYCRNCNTPQLVKDGSFEERSVEELFFILRESKSKRLYFKGGEPLMQGNALLELFKALKKESFYIKIETSGYYGEELKYLFPFLDWIALDVKASLNIVDFGKSGGLHGDIFLSGLLKSIAFLENFKGVKEIRTTIIKGLNDSEDVIEEISKYVRFCDFYFLQEYNPENNLIPGCEGVSVERMIELGKVAKKNAREVFIRLKNGEELKIET